MNTIPLFNEKIEDEIFPNKEYKCFIGAWYRKFVSSKDKWLGIEAVVELPEFKVDKLRYDFEKTRYMDNASIYLGGKALTESDVGLIFERGAKDHLLTPPIMSDSKIAYRPFWRYIDEDGNNFYQNPSYKSTEYYYFPGDVLNIKVMATKENYLQLKICVIKPTNIEKYVNKRKKYLLKDDLPKDFISPEFYSPGYMNVDAEFKRVNAIDQYGNEGLKVDNTNASYKNSVWREVYLYRMINEKLYKVPFTKDRGVSMTCPSEKAFVIKYDKKTIDKGGEIVSIKPSLINTKRGIQ